ncbi:hypothetical protein [Polyangium sp. y55x31]|uniref:hypothetical protein n=1 Tax=Polyangium sp. y55x31 TaxID=3042688 RepID=UPI0024829843|nr:hypothetical protein [Polyangium sp. y55x31]MDI1483589.1 hypothetical protein [Polyangium sp. y55x31]
MAGLPFQPPRPGVLEGAIPVAAASAPAIPPNNRTSEKPPNLLDAMNAAGADEEAVAEAPAKPKPTRKATRAVRARAGVPILRLLWFEPAVVKRIRAMTDWEELCDPPTPPPSAEPRHVDPIRDERAREERDVIAVLSGARPAPSSALVGVVERALGEHGELSPPVVVVAGELTMCFDPRERVRAMIAAATPLVTHDAALSASLAAARGALDDPALEGAEGIAKALLSHVRELVAKCKRGPTQAFLDAEVERALVAQRKYQKQDVFGRPWLRAELLTGAEEGPTLVYLPAALGPLLPLAERFQVRMVAEVDLAQDLAASDRRPLVLRAMAIARFVARSALAP